MEITAPGGDLEKIKYAVLYGANAVYTGYESFGLRAAAVNLDKNGLLEAISYCHSHDARVYLTLNAYLKNSEIEELKDFVHWLASTGIDAVIVSDPGVFSIVKSVTSIPIHISTQSNVTNTDTARFWHSLGAKRIVPARELSFEEILQIKDSLPDLEIECFIHGAMCVAYSGRCLLSAYLNNRSANSGSCTHPCRWNWALTEESRPGEYFEIEEGAYGTQIMSSKDLCLLGYIPSIKASGIHAGKIEGRMKSLYYVAQLTRIYKAALDACVSDGELWKRLFDEILKVSHRPYWDGFYKFGTNDAGIIDTVSIDSIDYMREWQYCGKVSGYSDEIVWFDALTKISIGDRVEIIYPELKNDIVLKVDHLYDTDKNSVGNTRPNFRYGIPAKHSFKEGGLVRKCVS